MDGAVKAPEAPSPGGSLDEQGHFFDFTPIYREPKFCDRVIRLEILEEELRPGADRNKDPGSVVEGGREAPAVPEKGKHLGNPLDSYTIHVPTTQPDKDAPDRKPPGSENGPVIGKKRPRDESESEASPSSSPEEAGAEKDREQVGAASRRSARLAKSRDETPGRLVNRGMGNGEEESHDKGKTAEATPGEGSGIGDRMVDGNADEDGDEDSDEDSEDEVEEIPVSSMVIAAKSLVLRRMMLSEMKEAQRDAPIVLKVTREEKRAVKELLSFIGKGSLSKPLLDPATCIAQLIAMLEVGDKFEVCSFMGAITAALRQRLDNQDNSDLEALAFDIPEHLQTWDEVRTLAQEGQDALFERFRSVVTWRSNAFLDLGERTVEFLLQSEDLRSGSEIDVVRGVVGWAFGLETFEERQAALDRLMQHVRLGCVSGELLEYLSGLPEMQSAATLELLQKATVFQSYSETKKLAAISDFSMVRSGFLEGSFEIAIDAVIDNEAKVTKSNLVLWDERKWHVKVYQHARKAPATVGVLLNRCHLSRQGAHKHKTHRLKVEVFVKNWPANYWQLLDVHTFTFKEETITQGWIDMFDCPWHDIKGEPYVRRGTNEVNLKVVVNQVDLD
ncbi:hypothetical protein KFL_004180100 [Klebsormidium nitens]|uniref:BACK domain-containing protein n=1 Tax=Klebsormidium nitens TaxID=105231 RepID=A0A1Y1IBI2_KLENI|nr:hypothetical protein KFL_004180100 [Klebsormidium nitens]|eukprot:GAQ88325.1 hypothetical protein KFL_004180100 [Klebsormidium nitens]